MFYMVVWKEKNVKWVSFLFSRRELSIIWDDERDNEKDEDNVFSGGSLNIKNEKESLKV